MLAPARPRQAEDRVPETRTRTILGVLSAWGLKGLGMGDGEAVGFVDGSCLSVAAFGLDGDSLSSWRRGDCHRLRYGVSPGQHP